MKDLLLEIIDFLENNKREHYYCEDAWYTCPKHPEGTCRDDVTECECGADRYNEQVDTLINKIKEHSK